MFPAAQIASNSCHNHQFLVSVCKNRPSLPPSSLLEAVHNASRVGVHWGTEVARSRKAPAQERHRVCRVYSSALPVAYNRGTPSANGRASATAVLRATFEATLLAAAVPKFHPEGTK